MIQTTLMAVVLVFAGAKAFRYAQHRKQSPFVLWEFRAGGSYSVLEKSAYRQTRRHFTCNVVAPSTRLCEMRVTGIGGVVRVLVDARDRVAVAQFAPDTASPEMREEGRRVAAEWNLIRAGASARNEFDTTATVTRWRTENGKWTAMMRYDRLGSTPVTVHLADETALAAIGESAPLASFVLAMNGLIESRDVPNLDDVTEVMRATMYGRATDPANETPAPLAPATPLALCKPERADPVLSATGRPDGLMESTRTLLEHAIPAVFPGSRLVFGDGMWIVDSTGVSESVSIGGGDFAGADEGTIVAAVHFRHRFEVASQRIEDAVPDRFCRTPGLLLFARQNDDRSLAEAHLVDVDHEAIASDIGRIHLSNPGPNGEPGHLRVRYTSAYAGQGWSGGVEWETVIAEDPPRTTVRVPLLFSHRTADPEDSHGGYLVVTGRPEGGIELSTMEKEPWGFTTRTTVVPVDSTGVLLGTRILERLAAIRPAP